MKDYDEMPAFGGDNLDAILDQIEADGFALETKSIGAPRRRPAAQKDGDPLREAVIAMGKEVLAIGEKVSEMKTAQSRARLPDTRVKQIAERNRATDRLIGRLGLDEKRIHELRNRGFEEFKGVNDRRLSELKHRGSGDPLDEQQLDRINGLFDELTRAQRRLSALEAKRNRPPGMGTRTLNGVSGLPSAAGEHKLAMQRYKTAVVHWMRTGDETHGGERLRDLMTKAMHTELNPAGGYLVLAEQDKTPLDTFLTELSPMRQRASIRQISTNELTRTTRLSGASARWTAERQAPTATNTPTLSEDTVTPMKMEAYPAASQDLLDDAVIDVEAWLAEEVALAFAELESDAWFNGNGMTQPRGLLTYDFVAPASWAHGKFRYIASGVSGGFLPTNPTGSPPTMPSDALLDMTYTIKQGHRNNASWMFSRSTAGEIRKFKDGEGRYIWQESNQQGQPPLLHGFPIDEDEFMPDIGADTMSVGFGDWKKTYEIVDRIGVRVLRDPYTSKPNIVFFTTKRVGGSVKYFDAAVFMKFGTS